MHQIKQLGLACSLLCAALWPSLSTLGQVAPPRELSLKDCLQYAIQHNQQLGIVKLGERTGQEKINETRSLALPQVNANGAFQDNVQKQVLVLPPALAGQFGAKGPIPVSLNYQMTAGATLDQKVFDQSVFTALKAARAGMDYYTMNTALTETQVIELVSDAYYRYQVTQTQILVLDSTVANINRVLTGTQAQFESGLARKIDVDRLKVDLTNLKTQRSSLQDAYTEQGYELRYLMGMTMDQPLDLGTFAPKAIETEIGAAASLDSGLNLNNRLEYTILRKQAELEGYQKKAYQAAYYPTLSISGNYSTNGVSDNFDFIGHNTTAIWYQVGFVALNLKVPIFDGGARKSRVHQAQINIDQYNRQAEQEASQLDNDYRSSKINLQTAINTIRAQKENWELAVEVYRTTQSNYSQGLSPLTELLDAQNSFLVAQTNYTNALLQYKLAEIGLIKASGNLKSLLN